jgi:hypothetical protein
MKDGALERRNPVASISRSFRFESVPASVNAAVSSSGEQACGPVQPVPPELCCNAGSGKGRIASTNGTIGNKFAGAKPSSALATFLPRLVYRRSAGFL